ncbi:hypothetical protein CBF27_05425 [Vagococcus acidifermentans]|uniref:Uncharacterized protein n=2 Tax=Vagococcus acidifermentans TaxID=564710 RepID=A0A430AY56_9ENTE|nr:hypothetical protein CBF27_05425 [Vagococcus acidifermentans]
MKEAKLFASFFHQLYERDVIMTKKKMLAVLFSAALLLTAGGCARTEDDPPSGTSKTTDSSEKPAVDTAVFRGKITGEVTRDDENNVYYILVSDVETLQDPEELSDVFTNQEVKLNVPEEVLTPAFDSESYSSGNEIEFSLEPLFVTTNSIPPQIPGKSIISVKLLEN